MQNGSVSLISFMTLCSEKESNIWCFHKQVIRLYDHGFIIIRNGALYLLMTNVHFNSEPGKEHKVHPKKPKSK